jgi:hypothetical protein
MNTHKVRLKTQNGILFSPFPCSIADLSIKTHRLQMKDFRSVLLVPV